MPTLQREVSWRWRPPSISLMDWKRFTRKSSKPGGRGFENDDARGGHTHTRVRRLEMSCPAVKEQAGRVVYVRRHTARALLYDNNKIVQMGSDAITRRWWFSDLWSAELEEAAWFIFFEWAEGGNLLFKDSKVSQRGKKKMWERKIHLYLKLLKQ